MKIIEAKKLAEKLKAKHDLHGWKVKFGTEYSYEIEGVIASCSETYKVFEFSPKWFANNDEWFCKDQILHEIAHALVGWGARHTEKWRMKCTEIGAIPHEVWEGFHPSYNNPYNKPSFVI